MTVWLMWWCLDVHDPSLNVLMVVYNVVWTYDHQHVLKLPEQFATLLHVYGMGRGGEEQGKTVACCAFQGCACEPLFGGADCLCLVVHCDQLQALQYRPLQKHGGRNLSRSLPVEAVDHRHHPDRGPGR